MKKQILFRLLMGAMVAGLIASLIHPWGAVKGPADSRPLLTGAATDPEVMRVVTKSCQNCHSGRTEWPWYSYAAPLSWMIEYDVSQARANMDLSHWDSYPADRQRVLLARIATAARSGQMPPSRYVRVHPEARLSADQAQILYEWARRERKKISK